MLRSLFAAVVLIHGLIHLLGFVKEWNLMPVNQLSGRTLIPLGEAFTKVAGALWLAAFLCFAIAAAGFLLRTDWWWMAGAAAVLLSQLLIVLYWKDAWAGTIANVIILPVVIVAYGTWSFDRMVRNEVTALLEPTSGAAPEIVTRDMLRGLPPVVQNWLEQSNVVGSKKVHTVRLKQKGTMRTKPNGSWLPFEAEQYFTIGKPAFIWKAAIHAAPFIDIVGRDKYSDGKGNMLIKLLSLKTIADSKGDEMNQGTLLRYLAEVCWFPAAALSDYLTWEALDSNSARVTMSYAGVSASGVYRFNAQGQLVGFEAQRYGEFDGKYSLEPWSIVMKAQKPFNGVTLPYASEVTWKLKTGDYTWLRLEITDLEYDTPEMYRTD